MTLTYLIGKMYQEEKKEVGCNQHSVNRVPHSEEAKSTGRKIAKQHQVSHATVERAEKFANAVDKVAENTLPKLPSRLNLLSCRRFYLLDLYTLEVVSEHIKHFNLFVKSVS